MKKLRAILLLAMSSVCLLTGCFGKEKVKIEFAETSSINEDVHKALQAKYTNFRIDKKVTVDKIDSVKAYSYKFVEKLGGIEDNKVSQLIEFYPGIQWFDEKKYPGDNIIKKYEELADSGFNTLMYYNYSQKKFAVVNGYGGITLNSSGLEKSSFSKIEATVSIADLSGEEEKRALDNSTTFLKKVFEIQNEEAPIPVKMCIGENQNGEKIYQIFLEQKLPGSSIDLFGTGGAHKGYGVTSEGVPDDRFASLSNYIVLDKNMDVITFQFDGNVVYTQGDELDKIPTLSSVMRYLDKEIAPNIKLTVSDISLKHGMALGSTDLVPVWEIECCKENEDPMSCTRFFVDCTNGRVDYIIDKTYGCRNVK